MDLPSSTATQDEPWRVGEHYAVHVYQGERPVATFFDALDAEIAVAARNNQTPVLISEELVAGAAQAIRDSNSTPDAREAWQKHPQIVPAHVYAEAVLAHLVMQGYVITKAPPAFWEDMPKCESHRPTQHRDGKPPWCNACGLTEDFREPISSIPARTLHPVE